MNVNRLFCTFLALASLGSLANAQTSLEINVKDCLVEAIDDNRISAGADGILTDLIVEEGMKVTPGQVIAMIDPKQAELNLTLKEAEEEQARLQAENDVNIRAAEKSKEFEVAEARSAEELYKKQAMPYWEMRREVLEAERSALAIELARNEKKIAEETYNAKTAERKLAEHEITRRQIKVPFAGIIATRFGKEGEWIQAGMPVVRVVRLDEVKVEGDVDGLGSPERIVIGAPVSISVTVASNNRKVEFKSRLEFVSPILASDNTYRVWAKIKNPMQGGRYLVSPGMEATMKILPTTQVTLN